MLKRFYDYLQRRAVAQAEMRVDAAMADLDRAYVVFCGLSDQIAEQGDTMELRKQAIEARADYIRKADAAYEARRHFAYIKGTK